MIDLPQNAERPCPQCGKKWFTDAQNLHPWKCLDCGWEANRSSELERLRVEVVNLKGDKASLLDLAEMAWGVIANASGGNWHLERADWQEAAAKWRERYHAAIGVPTKESA